MYIEIENFSKVSVGRADIYHNGNSSQCNIFQVNKRNRIWGYVTI